MSRILIVEDDPARFGATTHIRPAALWIIVWPGCAPNWSAMRRNRSTSGRCMEWDTSSFHRILLGAINGDSYPFSEPASVLDCAVEAGDHHNRVSSTRKYDP
jgi:hypothetical protein